jgi:hypothetical protein
MPSSKGTPTDPELREKIKEEVKAEEKGMTALFSFRSILIRVLNADSLQGGGAGSWSAWKAGELARRYEAQGGDYEDNGENKNKAQKGEPEKKEK